MLLHIFNKFTQVASKKTKVGLQGTPCLPPLEAKNFWVHLVDLGLCFLHCLVPSIYRFYTLQLNKIDFWKMHYTYVKSFQGPSWFAKLWYSIFHYKTPIIAAYDLILIFWLTPPPRMQLNTYFFYFFSLFFSGWTITELSSYLIQIESSTL